MTFKLVIFMALVAAARAGYINGGHLVSPAIDGVNSGLLRTGSSSYSSGYGYPLGQMRSYSSGTSSPLLVRPGYGSPYPYGGRNLPYQTGYGSRAVQIYPSSSYSYSPSQIFKGNGYPSGGFNGGYGNGYQSSNLPNYGHQQIGFTASPLTHNPHGSFNGLGTGYGY